MRLNFVRSWLLVGCVAAALTAACGGQGNALYSPVGPTGSGGALSELTSNDGAAIAGLASTANDAVAVALGKGNGKDKEKAGRGPSGEDPNDVEDGDEGEDREGDGARHERGHSDKVVGFVTATGTDSLTVNGIRVTAGATTQIHHGNRVLTLADIEVGDHVQAYGVMTGTTLAATEIKVEDTGGGDDDHGGRTVEITGAVSGLGTQPNAGCTATPAGLTFTVATSPATTVKTNSSTVFDDVTCANLANGNIVEVDGTRQADGSVLATKVELESGPDDVEGTITSVDATTSCPTRAFNIGTKKVTTTASTTYRGVGGATAACGDLAVGKKVEAEGTAQADGSITAASIEFK